jgi:hypothetical protein
MTSLRARSGMPEHFGIRIISKSLSALPISLDSRGPNREVARRYHCKPAGCDMPPRDPGQARRGHRRDPRRLPQHYRAAAAGPLTAPKRP